MEEGRRWRGALVGAALVLAAASCSSEAESTTPTVELSTTTVTTLPPTTDRVTTEAPTTTEDPRIAEVEAAVAAARQLQVEVLLDSSIPVEELEAGFTGSALTSLVDSVLMLRADGLSVEGDFIGGGGRTSFEGDGAVHVQCGLDSLGSVDLEGLQVTSPDVVAYEVRYELVKAANSGAWLVETVRLVGPELMPCDL